MDMVRDVGGTRPEDGEGLVHVVTVEDPVAVNATAGKVFDAGGARCGCLAVDATTANVFDVVRAEPMKALRLRAGGRGAGRAARRGERGGDERAAVARR